jgi:WD40 repeat protein
VSVVLGFAVAATAAFVCSAAVPDTTAQPADQPSAAEAPPAASAAKSGSAMTAGSEQRLALVIGNSKYKEAPLANPANDAKAMAVRLKQLGFKVIERENASLEDMRKSVRDFGNQLSMSDVGLFYYAGHGIQSNGVNYLIPVDADIQDETELSSRAFTAGEVLEKMDAAKNRINIVILDACRNNPLQRKVRSSIKGLAPMEQGSGTIIAFATKPGATSADGSGSHGLYTEQLLDALEQPGLSVEEVFKQVRMEVSQKSSGEQIPWENSSLLGEFYFNPTASQAALPAPVARATLPEETGSLGKARELTPTLVPRRLIESYQLTADVPLTASVAAAEYTPDGKRFVLVTQDRQLKVFETATGNVIYSYVGFDGPGFSADGRYLVGVSEEHLVNVLDTTADNLAVKTHRGAGDAQSVYIAPNGQRLIVISHQGAISVAKLDSDGLIGTAGKIEGDLTVTLSPAGNRAAVATTKNGDFMLVDLETGKRVGRVGQHKPITLVRFSPDGSLMLTAADDDATVIWRTADGDKVSRLDLGDKNPLPSQAEFIDDQRVLLNVALADKTGVHYRLGVWSPTNGKFTAALQSEGVVSDLQFSPDRSQLFATTLDHSVRVYDLSTRTLRTTLSGGQLLGFSSDGARFLVREGSGVRLYDTSTLQPVGRMPAQVAAFTAVNASGLYATTGNDGSLQLWEFQHGDPVSQLKGHTDAVSRVVFAAGGKRVATFGKERDAKFWALPDVQDLSRLRKDTYESTSEYQKRVSDWSSPFTAMVELGDYDADSETYAVKVGDYSFNVPVPRDDARHFSGQREAILSGKLKVFDDKQLQLADGKLERLR